MFQRIVVTLALAGLVACGPVSSPNDAGAGGGVAAVGGGSATGGGSAGGSAGGGSATVAFRQFTAPATSAVNGSFVFTISAEAAATEGFAFPPAAGATEPYFVDGWQLEYEHLIVTVDNLTLSTNPDMNMSDPSMTGPAVARVSGPWAVDLASGGLDAGVSAVPGKEGEGLAFTLARLTAQNLSGNAAFSTTDRYAFGFDLVTADTNPIAVNLTPEARVAYQRMRDNGWSYWVKGTATYRGAMGAPACRSTDAAYDYARVPKVVHFDFGWAVPTHYRNCTNQELMPMDTRGLQLGSGGTQATAQVTLHTDHPFWDALEEDAPLRFDAIAARKSVGADAGVAPASVTVSNADLANVDFEALTDAQGVRLPRRFCGPAGANEPTTGGLSYKPANVPVSPTGGAAGLKDLSDFMAYNLSTFGHLNAGEGLCVAQRQYPSPP